MLLEISYFVLIVSLAGFIFAVYKKIPVLLKLPPSSEDQDQKLPLNGRAGNLIKEVAVSPRYRLVFFNFLEKLLRRVRILFLKLDSLCHALILRSRAKSHVLTAKSKTWMSDKRMRKIEKLKLMASLRSTPEQKEENLLRSLRQNPKDIKAYKELGTLYIEKKNYQDASAAFEAVLKINPADEMAKEKLEEIEKKELEGEE